MTAKRPTKKAPAKAGADEPHKALPEHVLADATPGNRKAVALAYGHAAAWLKAGTLPPPELTAWLTDRLDGLVSVLRDDREKKRADAINAAVWGSQRGKRGRKPRAQMDDAHREFLAWDCYYERRMTGDPWEVIFERVADRCSTSRIFTTPTQVEAAWKDRKDVAPEIPEMDS
ncbi:hypothetical protein [Luteimonas sp. A478]